MTSEAERREGVADPGRVTIASFDEGVVLTMGAELASSKGPSGVKDHYVLKLPGVTYSPGSEGVQIIFGSPEDQLERLRLPYILVVRQDLNPAPQRWHSVGAQQARYPGPGALLLSIPKPGGVVQGPDRMTELAQALPYDITYQITCVSRMRKKAAGQGEVATIIQHLMKKFPFNTVLWLKDSLGDLRSYDAFSDTVGTEDEVGGVTERMLGFSFSLRVEGELDLSDPVTASVAQGRTIRYGLLLCQNSTTPLAARIRSRCGAAARSPSRPSSGSTWKNRTRSRLRWWTRSARGISVAARTPRPSKPNSRRSPQ